ncbi:MAG: magnetosome biogenesis CDF transporter MamB [Magnetococcus sp. DMHC-6]
MKYPHCVQCKTTVIWWAFTANVSMVFFKSILGVLSGSAALIADAFHSAADVIASLVTMTSMRISSKPADDEHPYGHGKIQFFSSGIVGMILLGGAIFLFIGAVKSVVSGEYSEPEPIAILGALISIIVNELMYHYQSCVGRENNSPAIIANAWDNRSDAMSSIAVLIGIAFAVFGVPIADPLAALGVSLVVMHIGFGLMVEAMHGLMDASPEMEDLQAIYDTTRKVNGIMGISYLRARVAGDALHIEINVEVDENFKVYEGDLIVEVLKRKISSELEHVGSVQVFLTPIMAE